MTKECAVGVVWVFINTPKLVWFSQGKCLFLIRVLPDIVLLSFLKSVFELKCQSSVQLLKWKCTCSSIGRVVVNKQETGIKRTLQLSTNFLPDSTKAQKDQKCPTLIVQVIPVMLSVAVELLRADLRPAQALPHGSDVSSLHRRLVLRGSVSRWEGASTSKQPTHLWGWDVSKRD